MWSSAGAVVDGVCVQHMTHLLLPPPWTLTQTELDCFKIPIPHALRKSLVSNWVVCAAGLISLRLSF